jgi:hypothetical protein
MIDRALKGGRLKAAWESAGFSLYYFHIVARAFEHSADGLAPAIRKARTVPLGCSGLGSSSSLQPLHAFGRGQTYVGVY